MSEAEEKAKWWGAESTKYVHDKFKVVGFNDALLRTYTGESGLPPEQDAVKVAKEFGQARALGMYGVFAQPRSGAPEVVNSPNASISTPGFGRKDS